MCCEASHILHVSEEAFDNVPVSIEARIVRFRLSFVALRRDHSEGSFVGDLLSYPPAAISLVADDGERRVIPVEEVRHHLAVM